MATRKRFDISGPPTPLKTSLLQLCERDASIYFVVFCLASTHVMIVLKAVVAGPERLTRF